MTLRFSQLILVLLAATLIIGAALLGYRQNHANNSGQVNKSPETADTQAPEPKPAFDQEKTTFTSPIADSSKRVTKKKFGTYVTPSNSPVSPEKFTGYHTGWDFEILAGEEDKDVPVVAFCDGNVVYKSTVSGYGGVAIQQCSVDGLIMTALYGHLRLSSVAKDVGDKLNHGDQVGLLGTGNSSETDGERKHLHFSLHRGTSINLRGYVSNKLQLIDWIDPAEYLE